MRNQFGKINIFLFNLCQITRATKYRTLFPKIIVPRILGIIKIAIRDTGSGFIEI